VCFRIVLLHPGVAVAQKVSGNCSYDIPHPGSCERSSQLVNHVSYGVSAQRTEQRRLELVVVYLVSEVMFQHKGIAPASASGGGQFIHATQSVPCISRNARWICRLFALLLMCNSVRDYHDRWIDQIQTSVGTPRSEEITFAHMRSQESESERFIRPFTCRLLLLITHLGCRKEGENLTHTSCDDSAMCR
jgi:hypothetical protein